MFERLHQGLVFTEHEPMVCDVDLACHLQARNPVGAEMSREISRDRRSFAPYI